MTKLLKIEFGKLFSYKTFIILLILYSVFLTLSLVATKKIISNFYFPSEIKNHNTAPKTNHQNFSLDISNIINTEKFNIFKFPDVWHNVSYIASWFYLLLAFIVIINITNEYSFRTIRSNVMNGLSRLDFFTSKIYFVWIISIASVIFVFLLCIIFGLANSNNIDSMFYNSEFIFAYFIQVITYLTLALFIGALIKRAGFAIVLLLLYSIVIEPLLALFFRNSIGDYLPLKNLNSLITFPFTKYFLLPSGADSFELSNIIISIVYCIIFTGASYLLIRKSDL